MRLALEITDSQVFWLWMCMCRDVCVCVRVHAHVRACVCAFAHAAIKRRWLANSLARLKMWLFRTIKGRQDQWPSWQSAMASESCHTDIEHLHPWGCRSWPGTMRACLAYRAAIKGSPAFDSGHQWRLPSAEDITDFQLEWRRHGRLLLWFITQISLVLCV